ncbi:MAG: hypothetical protein ACI837_003333, partial [Crocinitomicaceae bacterium]
ERSLDGYSYEVLTHVPAAGNSSEYVHYNYLDDDRASTSAYYRLSEKNMDGEVESHGIVYVDCKKKSTDLEVVASPNPNDGEFNLNIFSSTTGVGRIEMVDMMGKSVYVKDEIHIGKGYNHVHSAPELNAGIYLIYVEVGSNFKVIRLTIAK